MDLDALEKISKATDSATKYQRDNKIEYWKPYDFQKKFYTAKGYKTDDFATIICLICANQIGKTTSAAMAIAQHATGIYEDWWEGHRYDKPINILVASNTNEQTRDNCQMELCGDPNDDVAYGTGAIRKNLLAEVPTRKPGVPNAYDSVLVRHKSGGMSKIVFRAYEQGKKKFMGSRYDLVWADEEPPMDVYAQMMRSTFATDGRIMITFTPEEGYTELVHQMLEDPKEGQAVVTATWDDAPHMTEERRQRFLEQIPKHERDMRMKGIPKVGSGLVFQVPDEQIACEPFEIPSHWARIVGIDFGWEHPFAAVWCAIDRDTETFYVYDCYRESHVLIPVAASRIKASALDIPIVWPHDGLHHDKQSGKTLADLYRKEGLPLLPREFTNPPAPGQKEGQGGQGVEVGVMAMHEAMEQGRFKVFSNLRDWFGEKNIYHRKDGKIVKNFDDLMSATRYAFQSQRYASVPGMRRPVAHKPRRGIRLGW